MYSLAHGHSSQTTSVSMPKNDRYDYDRISKLVPGADHVTVLREPSKHFVSSWTYWGTANHIQQVSGMAVTMEQVGCGLRGLTLV